MANGRQLEGIAYLEAFMVALVDAALAAQNAAVAAESFGLGIVYVRALRNKPAAVAAELGLPPNYVAVFGLAVGHLKALPSERDYQHLARALAALRTAA